MLQVISNQLQNVHGEFPPYIGCSNGSNEFLTKNHRGSIQGHTSIDLQFLEDLFNHDIMPPTEECGVFESLASRRKYCGKCFLSDCQSPINWLKIEITFRGQADYSILPVVLFLLLQCQLISMNVHISSLHPMEFTSIHLHHQARHQNEFYKELKGLSNKYKTQV